VEKNEALGLLDALSPREIAGDVTRETHEQAMLCTSCGLAGMTPPDHFPQTPGLWDRPCPKCGYDSVWVTEPRLKE
jgi:hypothetical protein